MQSKMRKVLTIGSSDQFCGDRGRLLPKIPVWISEISSREWKSIFWNFMEKRATFARNF